MQNLSPTTRTNRTSSKSCTQLQLPLLALIATILAMVLLPTTTTRQRMNQTSSKTRTCSAHLQLPHLALIATILAMVHAFLLSTTTMSQRTSMTTCRELVLPSPPGGPVTGPTAKLYPSSRISEATGKLLLQSLASKHGLTKSAVHDMLQVLRLHMPLEAVPLSYSSRYRVFGGRSSMNNAIVHKMCSGCGVLLSSSPCSDNNCRGASLSSQLISRFKTFLKVRLSAFTVLYYVLVIDPSFPGTLCNSNRSWALLRYLQRGSVC